MSAPESAPPPSLAVLLFRDALSRAAHLENEARTLADYEYRSATPPRIANLIHGIVEQCEQAIREEWAEYQRAETDEERGTILNSVQTWDALLRTTGNRLRYIIGASASRVPSGLGRLLETIIKELELGDGILLREKWSYNYSIEFTPIEQGYHDRLSGVLSPEQLSLLFGASGDLPRTHAIGFPAIERDNTLLHSAIAHEIGHVAVERWLEEHDDSNASVAEKLRAAASRLLETSSSSQGDLMLRVQINLTAARIQSARRRFLQEYGSDLFAVELFGPAALLSMTSIAMSQGLDSEPRAEKDSYPSWRSRLRFALARAAASR
jgi:hypothetical protein